MASASGVLALHGTLLSTCQTCGFGFGETEAKSIAEIEKAFGIESDPDFLLCPACWVQRIAEVIAEEKRG